MVFIMPVVGPWLGEPILFFGFSLLFISILPGISAAYPYLPGIATAILFFGLA